MEFTSLCAHRFPPTIKKHVRHLRGSGLTGHSDLTVSLHMMCEDGEAALPLKHGVTGCEL